MPGPVILRRPPPAPDIPYPKQDEPTWFDKALATIQGVTGLPLTSPENYQQGGEDLDRYAAGGEMAAMLLGPLAAMGVMAKAPKAAALAGESAQALKPVSTLGTRIPNPIKAYHGSPHDFDQFSLSKIGTGEGAQAYGHGLYFAENPQTARQYRDSLSAASDQAKYTWRGTDYQGRSGPESHALSLAYYDGVPTARRIAKEGLEATRKGEPWALEMGGEPYWSKMAETASQIKSKNEIQLAKGRMYEVNLHVTPDELLDWDKPLSQQSEKVQTLMRRVYPEQYAQMKRASDLEVQIKSLADQYGRPGDSYKDAIARAPDAIQKRWKSLVAEHSSLSHESPGVTFPTSGEAIYRQLPDRMADMGLASRISTRDVQEDATAALRDQGIKGIQYLDQGSRASGTGTRNFVIFDDQLIEISRKFGIPLAAAAEWVRRQGGTVQSRDEDLPRARRGMATLGVVQR